MDLFGNEEIKKDDNIIRALCWYQPFGSLMLHGKIETREWKKKVNVRGKFLIYTSMKPAADAKMDLWCGQEIISNINDVLKDEPTRDLNGYAIALADLVGIRPMLIEDEPRCFVKHNVNKKCLLFENIQRIEPFKWERDGKSLGSQGMFFVNEIEKKKIKIIS